MSFSPSFPTQITARSSPSRNPARLRGWPRSFPPYHKAACRFADWCEGRVLPGLADVKPPHVVAYIEGLAVARPGAGLSKPTVKQHLAPLRMLFDWLVVGHVLDVNPAHAVRGPK
jgi:integrase/recombinase XerD